MPQLHPRLAAHSRFVGLHFTAALCIGISELPERLALHSCQSVMFKVQVGKQGGAPGGGGGGGDAVCEGIV